MTAAPTGGLTTAATMTGTPTTEALTTGAPTAATTTLPALAAPLTEGSAGEKRLQPQPLGWKPESDQAKADELSPAALIVGSAVAPIRTSAAGQPEISAASADITVDAAAATSGRGIEGNAVVALPGLSALATARQASPARAFGLDELGMFGLHGALAGSGSSQALPMGLEGAHGLGSAPISPATPTEPAGVRAAITADAQIARDAPPSAPVDDAAPALGVSSSPEPRSAVAAANLVAIAQLDEPDAPAATPDDDGAPSVAPSPAPRGTPKPDIVVLASGPDGAMQVMVAVPGAAAAALAGVRDAAERAAAEYGLRLGEVFVNGRKAPTVEVGFLGVSDGRRTS